MVVDNMKDQTLTENRIDFSMLLHVALQDDSSIEDALGTPVLLFVCNIEGQILSNKEIGLYQGLSLQQLSITLPTVIEEKKQPYYDKEDVISYISLLLAPDKKGYVGVVANKNKVTERELRLWLSGMKHSVQLTAKELLHKEDNKETQQYEHVVSLLQQANFTIEFSKLQQSINQAAQGLFGDQKWELLFYQLENDKLFVPVFSSTKQLRSTDHTYVIKKEKVEQYDFVSDKTYPNEEVFEAEHHYTSFTCIPLHHQGELYGLILLCFHDHAPPQEDIIDFIAFINDVAVLVHHAWLNEVKEIEQKRRQLLLSVTKKFHSSMDVGEILEEIIFALGEMYPNFDVTLLLSREWEVKQNLPVKQIQYGAGVSSGMVENAFLTGKIQIDDNEGVVYAPLRGKQGVYGVMEITTNASFILPYHEVDFVEMLADVGGNALENAELYQQSRNLINDLQLINQTSHQLNSNLRLTETINFMTNQILSSFLAEEVGFIMFHPNGELAVLEGSTSYYFDESSQAEMIRISEKVKREKDALFIGDMEADDQYSLGEFRSMLAVPMIQSGELKGMVLVLHRKPYHFTFENFKLLQSLIHHSTLAFTNSMLREELEKLVVTDYLTKLYSRNYLDEKVQESMNRDANGCFVLLDIDNFKRINDTFGHQVGDDIIIQVANVMKKNIREDDIAARWGGEELAVYLPNVQPDAAEQAGDRIVQAVSRETSPRVTVSCGISYWKQESEPSLNALFKLADEALYEAKTNGKNKAVIRK